MADDVKVIAVRIPRALYEQLRELASRRGWSVSRAVRGGIQLLLYRARSEGELSRGEEDRGGGAGS